MLRTLTIYIACAFFTTIISFSSAYAATLESFLTDKTYWGNFNWGKVYISSYFKKLPWRKYTSEEVAAYNLEYGKDKETGKVNAELRKKYVLIGDVAGVQLEASIEDKLNHDKTSTSLIANPVEKEINKDDYDKFLKSMISAYGDNYAKSVKRNKFTPVDILSFESYEWVLKNTVLHSTAVIFSHAEGKEPEKYILSISLSDRKTKTAMKPDIILSCEQTLSIGTYKDTRTISVVVKDDPQVQNMRNDSFFETTVKARVTDTSIYLTSDKFETTISRLTGNLTGAIYEEKSDVAGGPKKKGTLAGKCVKVSESKRAF